MGKVYLKKAILTLTCFCACALVGGCMGITTRDVSKLFTTEEPVSADAVAKYWDGPRVGAGMVLIVTVGSATTEPKEMSVLVDQNGDITLPYLLKAPIECDGLGLDALKAKIVKEYSFYIREPQVTVTFGPFDANTGVSPWGTVTVMGEVQRPGPVNMPATMDLTVTKVLQVAGGTKQFADTSHIRVTRCDKEGKQTCTKIDLREIGEDGRFDKDMLLKAGDVIYVPETWY